MIPGSVNARKVDAVIGTKVVKNRQMCVSVDYCLILRGEADTFVEHARAYLAAAAPDYSHGDDCTGIIALYHLDRLSSLFNEAADRQSRIVPLEANDHIDRVTRRMPISLGHVDKA